MSPRRYLRALRKRSSRVTERTGKNLFTQILEILRSRRLNPTLGTFDYYMFRLHDLGPQELSRTKEFLGWRVEEQLAEALNVRVATLPGWDKFTFHLYASYFGLPAPRQYAVFRPGEAGLGASSAWGTLLTSGAQLAQWLRETQTWPMFAKPSYSQQSKGCYLFEGLSSDRQSLLVHGGISLPIDEFVNDIVLAPDGPFFRRDMGYLFQAVLTPHPRIAELLGNPATSTIRVVVVQDDAGTEAIVAVWKMIRGSNISDTRVDDPIGHLHAPIDIATGIVGAAIDGYELEPYDVHPDTGIAIQGFQMPYWQDAMATCRRAARAFPMMRIQHWDLAITAEGPCLLEVNDVGAFEFLQKFGRGLITPRLREVLRRYGNRKRYPWIGKLCD